jgi:hypothetical protein
MVAWRSGHPRLWACRTGAACALGEHWLVDADETDELPVTATPFDWLASAGESLCVIDWSAPPAFWARLASGPRLLLPDEHLRRMLTGAIQRAALLPDMEVGDAA